MPKTKEQTILSNYGLLAFEFFLLLILNDNYALTFDEFVPILEALPKSHGSFYLDEKKYRIPTTRLKDSLQWIIFIDRYLGTSKVCLFKRYVSWSLEDKIAATIMREDSTLHQLLNTLKIKIIYKCIYQKTKRQEV